MDFSEKRYGRLSQFLFLKAIYIYELHVVLVYSLLYLPVYFEVSILLPNYFDKSRCFKSRCMPD